MARRDERRVNCLVIAVDYGTTFTGCAFRRLTFQPDGSIQDDETHTLRSWPPVPKSELKAPSEISLATASAGERQWGFDISSSSPKLILTKLQLEQQTRIVELRSVLNALKALKEVRISGINQNDGLARAYSKEPEQIMAEYLRGVREWLVEQLPQYYGSAAWRSTIPIDLVVTVPSGWSDEAKDRTLRAFREAGFDRSTQAFSNLREVITISEPEAAALYTVTSISERDGHDTFRVGECFILCDAGGGTVDLISYRITQTQPTLKTSQIGLSTGARCGASFIDQNFRRWLQGRLGPIRYEELEPRTAEGVIGLHTTITENMQRVMDEFDDIKKGFDSDGTTYRLSSAQHVSLTDKDIQAMFDPCVNRILGLINDQLIQASDEGTNVRYIFLCGGFAESPYLVRRITDFAHLRRMIVKKPENPWLAVVCGAVARGIEMGAEDATLKSIIRRHYGVSTSELFSTVKHSEDDAYIDPFDGKKKASHQMAWLIKKGDTLHSTKPKIGSVVICRRFGIEDPRTFRTTIVSCDDDEVPLRQRDIHDGRSTNFTISYDLSKLPESQFSSCRAGANAQPYFSAELTIRMELQDELRVTVSMNGRAISSVTLVYE